MARKQRPYNRLTTTELRKMGRHYWKVEVWNQYAENGRGIMQDCFGFIDYLVIDPNNGVIAVQSTSAACRAEHRRKILRNVYAQRWVNFSKIEMWTWRKSPQVRGSKRLVWKPTVEEITLDMFKEFANAQGSAGESIRCQ